MSALLFIVLGFLKPSWPWIASAFGAFFLFDVIVGTALARKHAVAGATTPVAVSVSYLIMWSGLIRAAGLGIGLLLSLGWHFLISPSL